MKAMTNKEFQDNASWGELLGPAMAITDQAEADVYFEKLVKFGMRKDGEISREDAEGNLRSSLGYYAGYYRQETRLRVECLFKCEHPVFGDAQKGVPTPQEAFDKGVELARKSRQP